MPSALIPVGRLQVATPSTMALAIRSNTEATEAVDERIRPVAVDIITNNQTVIDATAAAVQAKLATENVAYTLVRAGQREAFLSIARGAVTYTPTGGPFGAGSLRATAAGTPSAVVLTNAVAEPSGDTTLASWLRLPSIPTGQNRVACSLGGTKVYLGAAITTGNLIFSAADQIFISPVPIADGAWHFAEAVFNRTAGVTKHTALYVDGNAVTVPTGTQTSAAWDSTLTVLGFNALTQFDWPGEVAHVEVFRNARANPTVPTGPNTGGQLTLALARLSDGLVQMGAIGYPPRPNARAGMVTYVGSSQPTDWLPGDRWVKVL